MMKTLGRPGGTANPELSPSMGARRPAICCSRPPSTEVSICLLVWNMPWKLAQENATSVARAADNVLVPSASAVLDPHVAPACDPDAATGYRERGAAIDAADLAPDIGADRGFPQLLAGQRIDLPSSRGELIQRAAQRIRQPVRPAVRRGPEDLAAVLVEQVADPLADERNLIDDPASLVDPEARRVQQAPARSAIGRVSELRCAPVESGATG